MLGSKGEYFYYFNLDPKYQIVKINIFTILT